MGWFTRAIGKVASAVGSGVEKVGRAIHSDKIEGAGMKMQAFGLQLSADIGRTSSYDPRTATVRQTEDLSVKLAQYSRDAEQSADVMQSEIETEVTHFFDGISKIIDENNIAIPKSTMQKEHRDALKAQRGFLKSYVSKRLSLDDRECLNILKMENGQDKEQTMQAFISKVLIEGKRKLCDKLRETLEYLLDSFGNAFDTMRANQELSLHNAEKALDSLHDDTPSREYTQAAASTVVGGVTLIEQLLSEVN